MNREVKVAFLIIRLDDLNTYEYGPDDRWILEREVYNLYMHVRDEPLDLTKLQKDKLYEVLRRSQSWFDEYDETLPWETLPKFVQNALRKERLQN